MNLGEKLRSIRKSNDMNQNEFASRIGVSQGTLSDIERGVCLPSCETLIAIRGRFNCDLNWLLRETDFHSLELESFLTKDELKLIENFRTLSIKERNELLEISEIKVRK